VRGKGQNDDARHAEFTSTILINCPFYIFLSIMLPKNCHIITPQKSKVYYSSDAGRFGQVFFLEITPAAALPRVVCLFVCLFVLFVCLFLNESMMCL
jgi:hypothetical protein